MQNKAITKWIGGIIFMISFLIYYSTMPTTASFWDCGEFIACANGLQVGHAPGAPFYFLVARVFSIFASPQNVASSINLLSVSVSSLSIMFLFWVNILLLKKLLFARSIKSDAIILFSSALGAFSFAFTDTFWFSAIEAEVYAFSLFFTVICFWTVLKWEADQDFRFRSRWLFLCSYLMGLSVGVHLLNLLAIPVLSLMVYLKIKGSSVRNGIVGLLIGTFVLLVVQFLFVEKGMVLLEQLELLLVNRFGWTYHWGMVVGFISFILVLVLLVVCCRRWPIVQMLITMGIVFAMGTSSYALIVIRANADTPINLNQPKNVFALNSYLNREQYGSRPLVKGPWYGAHHTHSEPQLSWRPNEGGSYEEFEKGKTRFYAKHDELYFQRMSIGGANRIKGYQYWSRKKFDADHPPSFNDQVTYFFRYQLGHMFFRYFMWNFSGRQNHYQGHGDLYHGNFKTGIPFIDASMLGSREYPHSLEQDSRANNAYFAVPLLFGIIGIGVLIKRRKRQLLCTLSLLFMVTGPALAVFINCLPYEARERDYFFVACFMVYTLFISVGVCGILHWISTRISNKWILISVGIGFWLAVPMLLLFANYDDHQRKDRTLSVDMAKGYLNSCDPNAILFTYGDNDTYPLWYAQDVEGIRNDVRVINMGLLSADWYINHLYFKQYISEPILLSIPQNRYKKGDLDYLMIQGQNSEPVPLMDALNFVGNPSDSTQMILKSGRRVDFLLSDKLLVGSDSSQIIHLNKSYLLRHEIALLDIVGTNAWNRSIYFTNGTPASAMLGLDKWCVSNGITQQLMPAKKLLKDRYTLLKHNFLDHLKLPQQNKSWYDETCDNSFAVSRYLKNGIHLAEKYLENNKADTAQIILQKINNEFPFSYRRVRDRDLKLIDLLYRAQLNKEGDIRLHIVARHVAQNVAFYIHSSAKFGKSLDTYLTANLNQLKQINEIAISQQAMQLSQCIEQILDKPNDINMTDFP
ncbi:DUF2723 domain-containing protein [bacterium]|nr:DUF2723 domain-containing protein [bacterium]